MSAWRRVASNSGWTSMSGASVDFRGRSWRRLADQPYLLLSLASLFWAGNTIVGRFIVGSHIPPMTLACVRWGIAFLIVLPFAIRPLRRDWPAIRSHARLMTVLALTGFSAYNAMAYYGLTYTTAINGLLLQSSGPLFVALWTFVLFGDRLTARQALGICISLSGVLVIICHGSLAALIGVGFNRGDIWILIALLFYAYYTAELRRRPPMHPLSFLAVCFLLGSLLLVPAMAWEIARGDTFALDAVNLASLGYIALFPSVFSFLFLNRGIDLIGANRAAPFLHLIPVFGSVLAIVLLGERFEAYHAIGYALVFAGVTIATRK
jgi:drug/metabolite transporter (DMT)-like permease